METTRKEFKFQKMKKIIIIFAILLATSACEKLYDKGKKGDFLFRKCAKCGLDEN